MQCCNVKHVTFYSFGFYWVKDGNLAAHPSASMTRHEGSAEPRCRALGFCSLLVIDLRPDSPIYCDTHPQLKFFLPHAAAVMARTTEVSLPFLPDRCRQVELDGLILQGLTDALVTSQSPPTKRTEETRTESDDVESVNSSP